MLHTKIFSSLDKNALKAFSPGVLNAKFLTFSTLNTKRLPSSDVLYVKKNFETCYSND